MSADYLTPMAAVRRSGQPLAQVLEHVIEREGQKVIPAAVVEVLRLDALAEERGEAPSTIRTVTPATARRGRTFYMVSKTMSGEGA